jgi:hypothetical protein
MVIPPTASRSPRTTPGRRLGAKRRRRPRPPVPSQPRTSTTLPVSIFPSALHALREALPPDFPFPLEVLAPLVVERTPLANATLTLWSYLLQPSALDTIFQRHRGRSFEDILTFPTFVDLIRDALVLHQGSGRQSFQRAQEQGDLPTCVEAAYGKLRRVPISLSLGFFEDLAQQIGALMPKGTQVAPIPACLAGMRVTVLDGKQIKKVAKRLKPVRSKAGRVVGGKILVAYLPAEGLAVAMAADPDGEANDIRLMPRASAHWFPWFFRCFLQ